MKPTDAKTGDAVLIKGQIAERWFAERPDYITVSLPVDFVNVSGNGVAYIVVPGDIVNPYIPEQNRAIGLREQFVSPEAIEELNTISRGPITFTLEPQRIPEHVVAAAVKDDEALYEAVARGILGSDNPNEGASDYEWSRISLDAEFSLLDEARAAVAAYRRFYAKKE